MGKYSFGENDALAVEKPNGQKVQFGQDDDVVPLKKKDHTVSEAKSPNTSTEAGSEESFAEQKQPTKPSGNPTEQPNILNAPAVKAMQEVDLSKPEEETSTLKELGKFMLGSSTHKLFDQKQTKEQKVKEQFFADEGDEADKSLSNKINQDLKQVAPSLDKSVVEAVSMLPKTLALAQHGVELGMNKVFGTNVQPIEELNSMKVGKWLDDKAREIGIGVTDPRHEGFLNSEIPHMFGNMAILYATGGASGGMKAGQLAEGLSKGGLKEITKAAIKHLGPTAAVAGSQMGVAEFEKAKAMGATDDQAYRSFLGALPASGFYAIPIARQIDRINKLTGGGIVDALKTKGVNSIEMATQSAIYNTLTNYIAKGEYDPNRGFFDGLKESVGTGAFVGLLLPGIMKVAKENPKYKDQIISEAREAIKKPEVVKSPEQTVSDAKDAIKNSGDLGNINTAAEEIVDNIKQQSHAVQESETGSVLQREQSETGGAGSERGRVESSQQGQETTGESTNVEEPRTEEAGNGGNGQQEETLNPQQNENETGNGETLQGLGAQKVDESTIGFAPYRSKNVKTIMEDSKIRQSEDYKTHQENVQKIADGLGLKIVDKADTWGGYVDSETGVPVQEVSNMIHVQGPPEKIKLMGALLGKTSPEMQDSVLIGGYHNEGNGVEYRFKLGDFAQGEKAVKLLKENGLEYFTLDTKTGQLTILDPENTNTKNIVTFTESLKKNGIAHEIRASKINAEFIGSQDYDRIIGEGARTQVGAENGFDINAHIKGAEGKYEGIKNSQALTKFGVQPKDIPATGSLLTRLFEGLKKSGITTAKNASDWVTIGKGKELQKSLKLAWGGFEKKGFEETEEYQKLKKEGKIVENFDIKDISGNPVFVINPDNMLVGQVLHKGKVIGEGAGGINFVSKTGDVWAFSEKATATNQMVNFINDQVKKNGVAYVVVSKGDIGKLMSSHAGAKGAMNVLMNLVDTNMISKSDFRNALNKTGKAHGIDFKGTSDTQAIHKDIESKFFGKADNTFRARGTFVQDLISNLAKSESIKTNIKGIREHLNTKELPNSTNKKTGDISFSLQGMSEAIGLLFSDQATVGFKNSEVYAAIKVDSPVHVVKGEHESYPNHIRQVNGERPTLLLVNEKNHIADLLNNSENKPTTEGSLGSNNVGWAKAHVKPKADIDALYQNSNAQFRVKNGQKIIESLKDFNRVKNKAKAVVAFTHEVMHGTVTSILDAAAEGHEVAQKHANTIVDEFNKATGKKMTRDELLRGNDQFKQGRTSESYRAVQEFIARSWELYHRKGPKGFSEQFQSVLDAISTSFRQVYKAWKGSEIDVPLSKELEGMFNELLGKEELKKSENEKVEPERNTETAGGEPVSEVKTEEALPAQSNEEGQGEQKPITEGGLQQEPSPEEKTHAVSERVANSEAPEEVKAGVAKESTYIPKGLHVSEAEAQKIIDEHGTKNAELIIRDPSNGVPDDTKVIIAGKLYEQYIKEGNNDGAVDVAIFAAEMETQAGRTANAGKFWKMITTSGEDQIVLAIEKQNSRGLEKSIEPIRAEVNKSKEQIEAEIRRIVEERVQKEVGSRLEKAKLISAEKKKEIGNFFDALKIDTKNNIATASILPIGVLPHVWNGAVEVIKQAVLTGADVANSIQAGIDYIKANQEEKFDEEAFKKEFTPEVEKIIPKPKLEAKDINADKIDTPKISGKKKTEFLDKVIEAYNEGKLTDKKFDEIYASKLGHRELTKEDRVNIREQAKVIAEAEKFENEMRDADISKFDPKKLREVREKAISANQKIQEYAIKPGDTADTLIAMMQGNVMGPLSFVSNIQYNYAYQPLRFLGDGVASFMDYSITKLAKIGMLPKALENRTMLFPGAGAQKAYWGGQWRGLMEGLKQLKTGQVANERDFREIHSSFNPARAIKRWSNHDRLLGQKINDAIEGTIGWTTEGSFRILNLGDKPARRAAETVRAYELGTMRGLKGKELEKFIHLPDPESQAEIVKAGSEATFQQTGEGTKAFQGFLTKWLNILGSKPVYGPIAKVLLKSQMLFVKTPLNVVSLTVRIATPQLTFGMGVANMIKGNRRDGLRMIGEGVVGSALSAVAYNLFLKGLMTGDDDAEKKKRDFQLQNTPPVNSLNTSAISRGLAGQGWDIKNGDTWVSYSRLGPVGACFDNYSNVYKEKIAGGQKIEDMDYSMVDVAKALPRTVRNAIENSFLSGVNSALEATKPGDGDAMNRWLIKSIETYGTIIYPNTIASFAKASDEYIRDTKDDDFWTRLKDTYKAKMFMGDQLPAKVSIWGDKVKGNPEGRNKYMYYMFDPNKFHDISTNDYRFKLYNLFKKDYDPDWLPSAPQRSITVKGEKIQLTPVQYEELSIHVGKERAAMTSAYLNTISLGDDLKDVKEGLQLRYKEGHDLGVEHYKIDHSLDVVIKPHIPVEVREMKHKLNSIKKQ